VTSAQIAVTALGAVVIVWVLWYFLFSRGQGGGRHRRRERDPGSSILVKGGYTPDTIVVQAGKPVRRSSPRRDGRLLRRVVFERFGIDQQLPRFSHHR